uniref:Uncharacterized protein n=1 Tax=Helianthus annuus TaxID=4232 RepID=A0A251UWS9_HELAN
MVDTKRIFQINKERASFLFSLKKATYIFPHQWLLPKSPKLIDSSTNLTLSKEKAEHNQNHIWGSTGWEKDSTVGVLVMGSIGC